LLTKYVRTAADGTPQLIIRADKKINLRCKFHLYQKALFGYPTIHYAPFPKPNSDAVIS
jgi:hypothetical protein